MNVLVWKGYGIFHVYQLNNENFEKTKKALVDIVEYWNDAEIIAAVNQVDTWRGLTSFVEEYCGGTDDFENFEIVEVQ